MAVKNKEGKTIVMFNDFRTKNDSSGNPRRLLELFDGDGNLIVNIKYSYNSPHQAIREYVDEDVQIVELSVCVWITPKCYRERSKFRTICMT